MIIESLTVDDVLSNDFCNDSTVIFINDRDMKLLAKGYWFDDNISTYVDKRVIHFAWHDVNSIFIRVDYSFKEV